MNNEKFYDKDGRVAVLYSPGAGAGWSTWNVEFCYNLMFYKRIVELVLNDERDEINEEFMKSIGCGDVYLGGADALEVKWLMPGTKFIINEYNGAETIVTIDDLPYTA